MRIGSVAHCWKIGSEGYYMCTSIRDVVTGASWKNLEQKCCMSDEKTCWTVSIRTDASLKVLKSCQGLIGTTIISEVNDGLYIFLTSQLRRPLPGGCAADALKPRCIIKSKSTSNTPYFTITSTNQKSRRNEIYQFVCHYNDGFVSRLCAIPYSVGAKTWFDRPLDLRAASMDWTTVLTDENSLQQADATLTQQFRMPQDEKVYETTDMPERSVSIKIQVLQFQKQRCPILRNHFQSSFQLLSR